MRELIRRLDAAVAHRRRLVLVAWLLVVVAALPFAARQSERLSTGGFSSPGSGSEVVDQRLARDFPRYDRSPLAAVLVPRPGATAADVQAARQRLLAGVRAEPRVRLASARFARSPASVKRPTLVRLRTGLGDDASIDVALDLRRRLGIDDSQAGPVRIHLIGYGGVWSGMNERSKRDLAAAEAVGFPAVALILLAVFGSLAAAALPLTFGVVAVTVTGALIYLVSLAMDMSIFATNMASMIGIGVAVDYSLFVLTRFREEIRAGRPMEEARTRAMASSGVAVMFSGLAVIVSLAGLWLIPNGAMRSMGLGAILVVSVSLLATATLLPALLSRFGARVAQPGRMSRALGRLRDSPRRPGRFWLRWTRSVMRRPVLSVMAAGGLLLLLSTPVLDMRIGIGALRQFSDDSETVAGFKAADTVAQPGAGSPIQVLVESRRGAVSPGSVARIRRVLGADRAVTRLEPSRPTADGRSVLVAAIARQGSEEPATEALVRRARARLPRTVGPDERVAVGGATARLADLRDQIDRSMWKLVLFVLGLSFLVLLLLLRSVLLPAKAVVMNLLSVGAAFGVLVAVFQWGWLDGLFGFRSDGYVDWFTPPLVLAVVFGLSMDYEVFLLSRIRERYRASGDTSTAVADGLASSGRVITSAALIMVAVYAAFIGTGVDSIKQIGLGSAVAIGIDATLVRLVLMPAAMRLFGRWNWWLPRPLERLLPPVAAEPGPPQEPVPAPDAGAVVAAVAERR